MNNIVGAHASKLHDALINSQRQMIALTDADFEPIRSFQFLQLECRMTEIFKKQAKLFIDAFPDVGGKSPVIPEKGIRPSNDHCAGPS